MSGVLLGTLGIGQEIFHQSALMAYAWKTDKHKDQNKQHDLYIGTTDIDITFLLLITDCLMFSYLDILTQKLGRDDFPKLSRIFLDIAQTSSVLYLGLKKCSFLNCNDIYLLSIVLNCSSSRIKKNKKKMNDWKKNLSNFLGDLKRGELHTSLQVLSI